MRMRMNMKQIAELAGVSISTVSKILNDYSDVSEETKQRVKAIIQETGYVPNGNSASKTMAIRSSHVIGVIFAGRLNIDMTHPFFVEVINSFKKQMGILGYDLLFFSNEKFHPAGEDYLARCQHYQVDGCIIIQGQEMEPSIDDLDRSPIPCIGVDLKLSGKYSGYVMSDNLKISMKVVEHFYLIGYKEIGFIGSSEQSEISNIREAGLIQAMENFGIPLHKEWFVHGESFYEDSGYQAMKRLIGSVEKLPRAIFAASDMLAIGAMRALREHGIRVPEEIAIVGCDDMEASRYVSPSLTTVKQNKDRIGRLAALMLYDIIHSQVSSSSIVVEPELVVRESCGYPS